MENIDQTQMGSKVKAVTTADGCWLTRGAFSKNATVHVRNYCTNEALAYYHVCQRVGRRDPDEKRGYEGTSKSAEGYGAARCFEELKAKGVHIAIHCQDGDSSSEKSFRASYPDTEQSALMYCGGHVGRQHRKQLQTLAKLKSFSEQYIAIHKDVTNDGDAMLKCTRVRKHKKSCSCMSNAFISRAVLNHAAALVQAGTDSKRYAQALHDLGSHHARDEHTWADGQKCSWHDPVDKDGQAYHTTHPLTCPFHSRAYEIECLTRAKKAESVIHPTLGRGHSNHPEAAHHVALSYRRKDQNLCRQAYTVRTNMGLLQANVSRMAERRGPKYHWTLELFRRLGLPVTDDMQAAVEYTLKRQSRDQQRKATEKGKKQRISLKISRAERHEARKAWVRAQAITHTYGSDSSEDDQATEARAVPVQTQSATAKACRCGSSAHARVSHKDCPLNPTKKN